MITFGATSEIEEIEARIQSRVGEFLSAKKKIMDIVSTTPNAEIRTEASGLLATQKELEEQLPGALATIEKVKADVYSISDVINTGSFAVLMEKQVRDVEDLVRKSQGLAPIFSLAAITPNKILWVVASLGILLYLFKGRK